MGAHRLGQRAALPVILNPWLGKTTKTASTGAAASASGDLESA
jgi:hypothetical protein